LNIIFLFKTRSSKWSLISGFIGKSCTRLFPLYVLRAPPI
jgi:hypothetical protein